MDSGQEVPRRAFSDDRDATAPTEAHGRSTWKENAHERLGN